MSVMSYITLVSCLVGAGTAVRAAVDATSEDARRWAIYAGAWATVAALLVVAQ